MANKSTKQLLAEINSKKLTVDPNTMRSGWQRPPCRGGAHVDRKKKANKYQCRRKGRCRD